MKTKKASHSKGPWRAIDLGLKYRMGVCQAYDWWVNKPDGSAIGSAVIQARAGEAEANARLIAAGPDLLVSLKEAKSRIVDDAELAIKGNYATDIWRSNHKIILKQIRNAIAKAEGR